MSPMPAPTPAMTGDNPVPVRAGIGLKPRHFTDILDSRPDVGWFEVHPENYLVPGGPMLYGLEQIRACYPLSFHSVGMSLGSADGVDERHVRRLKGLCDRFEPGLVSDHLSWSRWRHASLNDLLPMPYTEASLKLMVNNVHRVQDILGRPIAIENPSAYCNFANPDMEEADFLVDLARTTGAGILLDVNNVFVSACNQGWSAERYLEKIPGDLVREIHLAGHSIEQTRSGDIRIDDHGSRVCSEVWALYANVLQMQGCFPTLIEWDTDIPDFHILQEEALLADAMLQEADAARSPILRQLS